MPQVTFTIKGLVACYRKPADSEFWSFVFPYDNHHHRVYFKYTKKDGTTIRRMSLAGKDVAITAPGSAKPMDFATDRFRKHVLDITATYLHNEGLDRLQPNKKMTIQNAVLDSVEERDDKFVTAYQFETSNSQPSGTYTLPHSASKTIGGTINIPSGKVVIKIEGRTSSIELSDGDKFEIDNYCGNCRRDFLKYHSLFKNKIKNQKFCDAISIDKFTVKDKSALVPMTGEPPAFCDGVWISGDSSGLD